MPGDADDAHELIRAHAVAWRLPVRQVRLKRTHRTWFFKRLWREFEVDTGRGLARVVYADWGIQSFEYWPTGHEAFPLPPWAAFPAFNAITIFWRMAPGEQYWDRWHAWYHGLSDAARAAYREQFPEPPEEERCWLGFYERASGFAPPAATTKMRPTDEGCE